MPNPDTQPQKENNINNEGGIEETQAIHNKPVAAPASIPE